MRVHVPCIAITDWLFGTLGLGIIGVYTYIVHNHSLPLTEGWFSVFARLVLDNKIPYRDFILYLPPFYVWLMALVHYVFGDSFWVLRIFGALIAALIFLALFAILRSRFDSVSGFSGAITACFYYQQGVAYISYDFTQVLTLLLLITIFCLIQSCRLIELRSTLALPPQPVANFVFLFLTGCGAGACLLVKQSNGLCIVVGVFLGYLLCQVSSSLSAIVRGVLALSSGVIVLLLLTLGYLFSNDALPQFIEQVIVSALDAKGSANAVLFSWTAGLFGSSVFWIQVLQALSAVMLLPCAQLVIRGLFEYGLNADPDKGTVKKILGFFDDRKRQWALGGCVITFTAGIPVLAWNDNMWMRDLSVEWGLAVIQYCIPIAVIWSIIIVLVGIFRIVVRRPMVGYSQMFITAAVSLSMIVGNGMSAGLSEISSFVVISWCLAWLLTERRVRFLGVGAAVWFMVTIIGNTTYRKFDAPYYWWGVTQPNARTATSMLTANPFQGVSVAPSTFHIYDRLIKALSADPQRTIVSFPNIPIVYLLASKFPDGRVVVPWYDFLSDKDALAEAIRIAEVPPDRIVYLEQPESVIISHERLFRGGRYSGQREIMSVIRNLCFESGRYTVKIAEHVPTDNTLFLCEKITET